MVEDSELNPPIGRLSSWWVAPALAAIYPVLTVYIQSIEEANLSDAAICGGVVVLAAIAAAYLFRFIFSGAIQASLAAVVLVGWSFVYAGYMRVGRRTLEAMWLSPLTDYFLVSFWMLLLFLALLLLFRLRWGDGRMKRLYQFVELACLFSIGFAVIQGVTGFLHGNRAVSPPVSIWESNQDVTPVTWKPAPIAEPRDIYYLVFDRYGNDETLRRFFGFDNSAFYDELEKRGFIVDRKATTSYPMTMPSMSSTLNMRYLNSRFGNVSDYVSSVQSNEVGKLLIEAGYEYHYFGNSFAPLRKSAIAQWNLKISKMPGEFADSLVNMTPFRPLIGRQYKRRFVLDKFARVAELAKDPKATFAYAHFLVPHPPYAFARDGLEQSELNRATRPEQELYIDQLVATNRLILPMIDEILRSSAKQPIIILQADEGPYLMPGDELLSRDEQIAKRTGILNAILIPDEAIAQRLPKPLKGVNTFRFLFKEYFGAPISLLPDRVFYWETTKPTGSPEAGTEIIDVTRALSLNK